MVSDGGHSRGDADDCRDVVYHHTQIDISSFSKTRIFISLLKGRRNAGEWRSVTKIYTT